MMTPQEVANCTFAKAVMGGYNMASVDDFLDKLTEDYSTLYKDNTALKTKMKVLVDKMEEYRQIEDAMRSTLLTAQKMATNMVSEAEHKRDELIADAAGAAKKRLLEIQNEVIAQEQHLADVRREVDLQIAAEHKRLETAQNELRSFIQSVQSVCNEELRLLERLPELPAQPEPQPAPAPVEETPAQESEPQEAAQEELASEIDAAVEKNIQDVIAAFAQEVAAHPDTEDEEETVEDPFAEEPMESADPDATRVLNLDDLQFGKNYTKD